MHIVVKIAVLILAYLIGSIATSVWIGRWFFNIDIREHGSGNAGSTNATRILGWKAGIILLLTCLKDGLPLTSSTSPNIILRKQVILLPSS